jgi:predicted RNA-binding protein (virulence factor B family)
MKIQERLRSTQELKNLQAEVKNCAKVEKQMRQAQLEPLQEDVENILTEMDAAKGQMENIKWGVEEMMKEHLTVHRLWSLLQRSAQK